jgi:hypothetical protein
MKLLSLVGATGVLLGSLAVAKADTSDTTTTTVEPSGAVTQPSGAETPPPANVDTGTPATEPPPTGVGPSALPPPAAEVGTGTGTPTTASPLAPAPMTNSPAASVNQDLSLPPPPNGQSLLPQDQAQVPPAVQPLPPEWENYPGQTGLVTHIGVAMLLGGGFQELTNSQLRDRTGNGGYWDVRVIGGTREFVGFEAAYVGSARGITALGYGNDARLLSNGLEGDFRVNLPLSRGYSLIEPFGFVGLGWQNYEITGNTNPITADLRSSDNVMTLPFGGGLEFAYHHFMADARFTYRQTYYNNLTETIGGNLNNWNVGGQIGFEY